PSRLNDPGPRATRRTGSTGSTGRTEKGDGEMKLVVAIIRPDRVTAVLEELFKADVQGVSISRVQGHGGEREHVETYRGTTVKMGLSEKVRLEIGVSNHFVQPTVAAILQAARTG